VSNPLPIPWEQNGDTRIAVFQLLEGDSVQDPSSTRRVISGPALVQYIEWPDGGVTAYVTDLREE
jgi:hypothetical protein